MLNFSTFRFGEIVDIPESHDLPQAYFDEGYFVRYFETPEEEAAFLKEEESKKAKAKQKATPSKEKDVVESKTLFLDDIPEVKGTKAPKED